MTPHRSNHAYRPSTGVELTAVMAACPDVADMAGAMFGGYVRNWDDLHRAAGMLRPSCGISKDAWNVAQRKLGLWSPLQLWRLSTDKHAKGEVASVDGYLRGIVAKALDGELRLERSFYGRMSERRV